MLRRVAVVGVIVLSLLPQPLAAASHSTAVSAEGPDPDGAYTLTYDVHRDAAGKVAFGLDVTRTDAEGSLAGARELDPADLPAGTTRLSFAFLPSEGPGGYSVALVTDGVTGAALEFDVADEAAGAALRFQVPDEPTWIDLTNDPVNANGKVKVPGEALLTRGTLADGNGLADVDAFSWRIEHANGTLLTGTLAHPTNATSWSFEHRFDASPFPAGDHTLHLEALREGVVLAQASRTFALREVAPTLLAGALANVTPDEPTVQTATLVLADRNGPPSGALEARVYRASTRVEGLGFHASLGEPTRLADAEGAARTAYPLSLRVPERATPASYRVSIYSDGALLGSLPFDVRALPTLASANATTSGGRLVLAIAGGGDGLLIARLSDGAGSTSTVASPLDNGTATLTLDPPRRGVPLAWNVSLHVRPDGRALAWRTGTWSAPDDAPPVSVVPLHVRPRLPAAWRLESPWPLDDAQLDLTFARWDGTPDTRLSATLDGGRVRVDAPPDLAAGRYTGTLVASWPNGTSSRATWSFDAGPWAQIELGTPSVEGRVASIPLRNAGGVAISKLVVETEPSALVKLARAGATHTPAAAGARAVFTVPLAPGEEATLRIEIPAGPMRSGEHVVALRVLARVHPP